MPHPIFQRELELIESHYAHDIDPLEQAWAYVCKNDLDSADRYLQEAKKDCFDAAILRTYLEGLRSEDNGIAIECFLEVIEGIVGVPRFHLSLAEAYMLENDYWNALEHFETVLKSSPHQKIRSKAQSGRAKVLTSLTDDFEDLTLKLEEIGSEDVAMKVYTLLIASGIPGSSAWECRGKLRLKLGDAQGALTDFTRACTIDPMNARALLLKSEALWKLDRKAEAIQATKKARAEGSRQKIPVSQIEATYFAQVGLTCKDSDDAIKHLTLAVEAEPESSKWQKLLAEEYLKAEKYQELITFIDEHFIEGETSMQEFKDTALERLKSIKHSRCVSEAEKALEAKDWKTAVLKFSEAIELLVSPAEVYFGRSKAYAKGRKFVEALADLAVAAEKNPENDEILFEQAQIHQALKDSGKAYKILRKLILSQPDNKQFKAAYRNLLGTRSTDRFNAIKHFTAAIEADPTVAIYYCNRATVYNDMSDFFLALEDVHAALKIDKDCPEALSEEAVALEGLEVPETEEPPTEFVELRSEPVSCGLDKIPEASRTTTDTSLTLGTQD